MWAVGPIVARATSIRSKKVYAKMQIMQVSFIYVFEFNVRQHVLALGYIWTYSWQAELLAQVAKDGRRNT
jgi:hypothetical protein